jgi:hypothetical protein
MERTKKIFIWRQWTLSIIWHEQIQIHGAIIDWQDIQAIWSAIQSHMGQSCGENTYKDIGADIRYKDIWHHIDIEQISWFT